MAKHVINITDAHVLFADDEPGLTTGVDYACQVISAAITPSAVTTTAPATFCESETDILGKTKFSLELNFLQDWDAPGGGLSAYLYDNDTMIKWVSISLDDTTSPLATGPVAIAAGAYGGDAGTPLESTSSMPFQAKPTILVPTGP